MKTLHNVVLSLILLMSSSLADAGVFTYMAASDAASAARDVATNMKNTNKGITVVGRSVMCSYASGYCTADTTMPMYNNAMRFFPKKCGTSYQCSLTPDQFIAAYTGIRYPVKSITYTYIDKTVAIIEY